MKTEKERVVCSIETGFRKIIEHGNPMQQLQWIIEIQKCYFTFGMTAKAQSLYPEIQAKGVEVKNCLFPQTYQFSIPKNVIQALEAEIICGTTDEIYSHFVDKFTLKKSSAEEFVKKQAQNPLTGMVGTLILSESGMPLSEIGTPEYDKEGNEYAFGAKLIEHEECVMRHIVEILLNNQIFSKDLIVKHIMVSGLIHSDRISVIEKGVELYLNEDYIMACHLLMPQIEHALCNLALRLGAQALRMQNSGNGYMVQLMDKLFDVPEVYDVLGDDKSFYLRTLLTEQRGMNLRNMLCHGLINPIYYNAAKADRIIHALLLVGELRVNNDTNN